jgi:GNAT superfamily N-acetyltransferase
MSTYHYRGSLMNIEIKRISPDLLDDWLYFFDNVAFCNDDEWSGCYCMCYHWTKELADKKSWNCSYADKPFNRECAIDFIKKGKMQGYLAFADGKVAGWCNANDKDAYDNVNFRPPRDETENGKKVKCVVCFCISPECRGKGVATSLLKQVCIDAKAQGYDMVEGYPFEHDENKGYHGPVAMYEKLGFVIHKKLYGCVIYRKEL